MKLGTQLHLVPRLTMSGTIFVRPHPHAFMASTRASIEFTSACRSAANRLYPDISLRSAEMLVTYFTTPTTLFSKVA